MFYWLVRITRRSLSGPNNKTPPKKSLFFFHNPNFGLLFRRLQKTFYKALIWSYELTLLIRNLFSLKGSSPEMCGLVFNSGEVEADVAEDDQTQKVLICQKYFLDPWPQLSSSKLLCLGVSVTFPQSQSHFSEPSVYFKHHHLPLHTPSLNWLTLCFDEMWNILMCHIDKNYLFILLDLANDSSVSMGIHYRNKYLAVCKIIQIK